MASVQQAQGVAQINHEKEKAVLSELVSEAQALLEKKRDVVAQPQLATVGGIIRDSLHGPQGARPLKLEKIFHGFGHFLVPPTDQIGKQVGTFVHSAQSFQIPPGGGPGPVVVGSKAAVIYSTFDDGIPQIGYLLGWFKAQSSPDLKVYVQAGDPNKLLSLQWPEIEKKIDASGNKSEYLDNESGAFAAAEIKNFSVGGNLAGLGANFTRLPPN